MRNSSGMIASIVSTLGAVCAFGMVLLLDTPPARER